MKEMPNRIRSLILVCFAAAAMSGCAAAIVVSSASAAAGASVPTPSTSTSAPTAPVPIQIILPSPTAPATSLGLKDFLVPMGTLLGAALGFGGAITGARLAASAQDKRSRQDAEIKRQEEEKTRAVGRLEAFADQANSLMGDTVIVANSKPEAWSGATAINRDALRLRAAQMLGTSRLLDADLEKSVGEFIGSTLEVSNAPSSAQARRSAQRCGATFEALMQAIGGKLQSPRSTGDALDAKPGRQ
jgi:hypothetical protein